LSPPDKTSLLVEFFCWENDQIWNASKAQLYELSVEWLERLGLINCDEVIDYFIHKERDVYPVYDLNYRIHLRVVAGYLRHFENLQLIGSAGSFKYSGISNALMMGTSAARNIINVRQ
jgi:protoporphyrinogen oxidase